MRTLNKHLDIYSFVDYLNQKDFGEVIPKSIVIHQYKLIKDKNWQGEKSYLEIKKYYKEKFQIAGPHILIANDGIWLFTDMHNVGKHSGPGDALYKNKQGQIYKGDLVPIDYSNSFDYKLLSYSIGVCVIGNYEDIKWQGKTKLNALYVISCLQKRLNLFNNNVFFHREIEASTCPGLAITKNWLFYELGNLKFAKSDNEENKQDIINFNRAKNIGLVPNSDEKINKKIAVSCMKTVDYLERRMNSLETRIKTIEKKK